MTTQTDRPRPRPGRPIAWVATAGLVVLSLVLTTGAVWVVSSKRAETRCVNRAEELGYTSVMQRWSWSPIGTRCVFGGGAHSETHLWW